MLVILILGTKNLLKLQPNVWPRQLEALGMQVCLGPLGSLNELPVAATQVVFGVEFRVPGSIPGSQLSRAVCGWSTA